MEGGERVAVFRGRGGSADEGFQATEHGDGRGRRAEREEKKSKGRVGSESGRAGWGWGEEKGSETDPAFSSRRRSHPRVSTEAMI